jgi:hypothetical protein
MPPKYPTVAAMGEKVGMRAEYDGFYKFYGDARCLLGEFQTTSWWRSE